MNREDLGEMALVFFSTVAAVSMLAWVLWRVL